MAVSTGLSAVPKRKCCESEHNSLNIRLVHRLPQCDLRQQTQDLLLQRLIHVYFVPFILQNWLKLLVRGQKYLVFFPQVLDIVLKRAHFTLKAL